jgi:hypothetical protein
VSDNKGRGITPTTNRNLVPEWCEGFICEEKKKKIVAQQHK